MESSRDLADSLFAHRRNTPGQGFLKQQKTSTDDMVREITRLTYQNRIQMSRERPQWGGHLETDKMGVREVGT
jgi:hypothetical protein